MRVRDALAGEMEAILRDSHAVWAEGMSPDDYIAFNVAQRVSPWGRERYRFLVGEDSGRLVAALKLTTLPGTFDGPPISIAGIGAVFTPEAYRGRGHAAALVAAALEEARGAGRVLALLMSEIGPEYYARLGFESLPALEAGCLPFLPAAWPGEPAWLSGGDAANPVEGLRPFVEADLDALVAIHDEASRGQRFRVRRDRPAWEQVQMRAAWRRRVASGGDDAIEVIERDGRIEAYVVLREAPGALQWREHGARLGAEERLIDLFWTAIARARRRGVNRIDAWQFPAVVTTRRLYPIAVRPLREPAIMVRRLDPGLPPLAFAGPEECRISWLDLF